MEKRTLFTRIEELIIRDRKFLFTVTSYITILIISTTTILHLSPLISSTATVIYFMINASFLGQVFFRKENFLLRFALGNLILIVFLGLIAWAVMIIYNLDVVRSAVVLSVVSLTCSFLNKRVKDK